MTTDFSTIAREADTFPKLLRRNAAAHPGEVSLREKIFGLWRPTTWAEYHARTRPRFALGLSDLGIDGGDVVGLIGDNRPDWVAARSPPMRSAPCRSASTATRSRTVQYLLAFAEVKAVIAEDEEQVDKLLNLADQVPSLRHIVYCDPRGMRKYDDPRLISADALAARGEALHAADPGLYDRMVDATDAEAVAILCTTSGTTARPKLAMLSGGGSCATAPATSPPTRRGRRTITSRCCRCPGSWSRSTRWVQALLSRMKVNFVEDADTLMHDFREIAPTFVLFAPRVWEAVAADVRARMMDASPFKRALYERGMRMGLSALDRARARAPPRPCCSGRSATARLHAAHLRGDRRRGARPRHVPVLPRHGRAVAPALRPDRDARRLHPAPRRDGRFRHGRRALRRQHRDPGAGSRPQRHRRGAGAPRQHVPRLLQGRCQHPERRARRLDAYRDAGYVDKKGELVVIDRIKDLAVNIHGERFSPQYIENKLKFSPYVAEAVILGAGREYLAALVCIRYAVVAKWAEKNRIAFTTYSDLAAKPAVIDLIRREVEKVNAGLTDVQRVAKFVLLYKELDADDGELTPHPQGPPRRHQREVRRPDRHDLCRRAELPGRYGDPVPGRHDAAHPHHPAGDRPHGGPRHPRRRRIGALRP